MPEILAKTDRTAPLRMSDRMSYEAAAVHTILDEGYVCHVGLVVDDEPRVLPMLHVRIDQTLYLHTSSGGRLALAARAGGGEVAACVAVTLLDGFVLARSQFHHSANYRCVIAHGAARVVTDAAERSRVLTALVDKVAAGRSSTSRPPTGRELSASTVFAIPLNEAAARVRSGGVNDDPEDLAGPHWAGVLPLLTTWGRPEPAPGVTAPVPEYLRPAGSPWARPVPMRGALVSLEPLDLADADGLFEALCDSEVWRHQPRSQPKDPEEMAAIIEGILDVCHQGTRASWTQRDAGTGRIVGTTSYWMVDPAEQSVHIGASWLGRRSWRTGINTESKLLLLTRAFETLGAERVELWTDVRNERSQHAIERLGALREGVLRSHRRRADGTRRDTVAYSMLAEEWPDARDRLTARLARG
jgi:uncharacterized protein